MTVPSLVGNKELTSGAGRNSTTRRDFPIDPSARSVYGRLAKGRRRAMKILLVGVACVGKTTIGERLAERLDYPFFDLDEEVEKFYGTSIERLQKRWNTWPPLRKGTDDRDSGRQPSCRLSRRLERVREPFRLVLRPACVDMPLTIEPSPEAPRCPNPKNRCRLQRKPRTASC